MYLDLEMILIMPVIIIVAYVEMTMEYFSLSQAVQNFVWFELICFGGLFLVINVLKAVSCLVQFNLNVISRIIRKY